MLKFNYNKDNIFTISEIKGNEFKLELLDTIFKSLIDNGYITETQYSCKLVDNINFIDSITIPFMNFTIANKVKGAYKTVYDKYKNFDFKTKNTLLLSNCLQVK